MNFLLGIDKSQYGEAIIKSEGLAETFLFGGQIVLIGMVTVFAVLGLLFACLTVFKIVFHDMPSRKKEKVLQKEVVDDVADEDTYSVTDDSEIIAVIAAAIAAAESESDNGTKFRVVSFRRK